MNKEEFKIYAENSIMDITHRIDEIRQRVNTIDDNVKEEFDQKVTDLLLERDALKIMIDSFDDEEVLSWEEIKREFYKGIEVLQQGFEKLFNLLSV